LATLRSAEFGFFGVVVYTRVHTPRFCGQACMAGTLVFLIARVRGLRTSWLIVGIP
jgi:polyferredoxin